MPYCPKCDMEFVEGMTTCTDCGGPLVPSKEEWLKEKALKDAEEKQKKEEELAKEAEAAGEEAAPYAAAMDALDAGDAAKAMAAGDKAPLYTPLRKRAEDMKSSRNAFVTTGAVLIAASVFCWVGVIPLPMAGLSKIFFETVITLLGAGCMIVALRSQKEMYTLLSGADAEEQRTRSILDWFTETCTADDIDGRLLREEPNLEGAELDFRRSAMISDLLVTGKDLPDPSYVDYLTDILMDKLYGEGSDNA